MLKYRGTKFLRHHPTTFSALITDSSTIQENPLETTNEPIHSWNYPYPHVYLGAYKEEETEF